MSDTLDIVDRLCTASRKDYDNPYETLEWPEALGADDWFFTPELMSVHGTALYDNLSEAQRKRLSFFETINFFSLNIHGEKPLVEGLARRLYEDGGQMDSYLHHFLDEENKHMIYFGGFCRRYAGKIYPDKKLMFPREYAPGEEDFLFFAKVMIFEEVVDVYNVRMAADVRLPDVVRQINHLHHQDEARHLGFGRRYTKDLFDRYAPSWSKETVTALQEYLKNYLVATWREYYNPQVYVDAGLPGDPFETMRAAYAHPEAREQRRQISQKCVAYLLKNGMLAEEPTL